MDRAVPLRSLSAPSWGRADTMLAVQTRYLILAALATGLIILVATALWFTTL